MVNSKQNFQAFMLNNKIYILGHLDEDTEEFKALVDFAELNQDLKNFHPRLRHRPSVSTEISDEFDKFQSRYREVSEREFRRTKGFSVFTPAESEEKEISTYTKIFNLNPGDDPIMISYKNPKTKLEHKIAVYNSGKGYHFTHLKTESGVPVGLGDNIKATSCKEITDGLFILTI